MSVIKAGYRLSVTSWENDADNYNTEIVDGLSKSEVQLAVDLLNLVKDSSSNTDLFGNMYDPDESEIEAFKAAIEEVFKKNGIEEEQPFDLAMDLYYDYGIGASEFFTRVAEKVVVEYVPADITISDVTQEFIK